MTSKRFCRSPDAGSRATSRSSGCRKPTKTASDQRNMVFVLAPFSSPRPKPANRFLKFSHVSKFQRFTLQRGFRVLIEYFGRGLSKVKFFFSFFIAFSKLLESNDFVIEKFKKNPPTKHSSNSFN